MSLKQKSYVEPGGVKRNTLDDLLFQQHPLQMFILDAQNNIIKANKSAAEFFNINIKDLCGRHISGVIPDFNFSITESSPNNRLTSLSDFTYSCQPFSEGKTQYVLVTIIDSLHTSSGFSDLSFRAELEMLLKNIAASFININTDKIDFAICNALELIGKIVGADRSYLFIYNKDVLTMSNTHEWCADGIKPAIDNLKDIPLSALPWWSENIFNVNHIYIPFVSQMPEEAKAEKELLEAQEIKSLIVVPVFYETEVLGFIGLDYVKHYKEWSEENLKLLRFLGSLVASVLIRKDKDEQHERTNFLFKLIVERIRDGIIVEDEDNRVLLVNRELCRLFGITASPDKVIGKKWYNIINEIQDYLLNPAEFTVRVKELTDRKEIAEGEVIKLKTGTIVERDYIPLYNKDKFIGHLRKYKDITPIKLNEEKILGDQSRLSNILFALNTTAYSRIIESKDVSTGDFVSEKTADVACNSFYKGPALMSDLIYEEDKIKVMDFLTEILKTGFGEIEYRTVAADGHIRWIHDRCKLIRNKENFPISIDGMATDVTDKKMMQIALEESEQRYRHVVNSIKEVLFQTDGEGRWTFLNPAWEELTGYTVTETLGKHFWAIMHPDDINSVITSFQNYKESRESFIRREVRYLTRSREERWMEAMVRFNYDNNGQIIGTFGTWLDVTERKIIQLQLELRDKAISAVQSGIIITDPNQPDNPIIFCNPGFEKISGYHIEEVLGRNCRFMQGPDTDNNTIAEIRQAINDKKHCSVILKNYRKDGTSFWNNLTISPIFNSRGSLINFVGIQSDITNRIEAEAALLESETKYRTVVESIKEVIFQTDNNGIWTYLNKSWEEITGYTVEESLGELFLNYVHPEDRDRNQQLFEPLIRREKEYCRHTVRYLTKDGGFRFIEVFARLTLDKDENIIGTSGTLYDVTDRLKAEDDIKLALEKQKELNELKSRFISTVSHEFRTPLTSILASADLLQRYIDKWDDDKKIKTLNRIQDSVEHMNSMINDVLTLNKSESGAVVYNPVITDIVKISRSIFDEIKLSASDKHIFIFEAARDEIIGSFDEKLFRQLLQNLLSNAVKYSPDGGEVKLIIQFDNKEVTVTVSDQGVGIAPEDQAKLFSPFFRGANIGNIPGTGLGLSIFQKALEMQKGHLSFSSDLNKGTTFKFSIPYRA